MARACSRYRVASVGYRLAGKPRHWNPRRAFRSCRVTITLEAPAGPARVEAEVSLEEGTANATPVPHLDGLDATAAGDPELESRLRAVVKAR